MGDRNRGWVQLWCFQDRKEVLRRSESIPGTEKPEFSPEGPLLKTSLSLPPGMTPSESRVW